MFENNLPWQSINLPDNVSSQAEELEGFKKFFSISHRQKQAAKNKQDLINLRALLSTQGKIIKKYLENREMEALDQLILEGFQKQIDNKKKVNAFAILAICDAQADLIVSIQGIEADMTISEQDKADNIKRLRDCTADIIKGIDANLIYLNS